MGPHGTLTVGFFITGAPSKQLPNWQHQKTEFTLECFGLSENDNLGSWDDGRTPRLTMGAHKA